MIKKLALVGALVVVSAASAMAQGGCSYIKQGAVLTAAQWNQCFANKQDVFAFTPIINQGLARSVLGVPGNANGTLNSIQSSAADQVFRSNGTGDGIGWGSIDLSKAATVGTSRLVNGNLAQGARATLSGNPTAALADIQNFSLSSLTLRTPDATNDLLLIWDSSTNTLKRTTPGLVAASATAGVSSVDSATGALTTGSGLKVATGLLSVTNVVQVDDAAYGAACNGSTDDTTAIQAAANAGRPIVRIPAGKTCIVDQVTLANGTTLEGYGPDSVLKRKNSASNTLILAADGKHSITLRNVTLDGNKANNTTLGGGASFTTSAYDIHLDNVVLKNMKANAGGGWGANLDTSADAANHTESTFTNVTCLNNDNVGILMKKVFNVAVDRMYSYGCQMAALLDSTVGGNHESGNISFTNINVDCASVTASSSIQVLGGANSTGVLGSVYSNTIRQTWNVEIHGVQIKNCKGYGIVAQAKHVTVSDVQITDLDNASPGGMLFNSLNGMLVNSIFNVSNLASYSIDAGGCIECIINGNRIDGVTFNLGATQYTTASGNTITGSNGNLVSASTYDSDGTSVGAYSWAGTDLKFVGNKLICGSSCVGFSISDGFPNLYMSANDVCGTTSPYIVAAYPVIWGGQNTDCNYTTNNGNLYIVTATGDVVIPENATSVYLTGPTAVNTILTFTQATYKNGLYAVVITNPGTSPYSSPPTVTQTGGTCSVAPTFNVALDGNGFVGLVRIAGVGTCSVIPTGVSFSGGGGSGAAGSVRPELVPTNNGSLLNLVTESAITLGGGPGTNIFPRAALSPTVAGGVYQFVNVFGSWGQPR